MPDVVEVPVTDEVTFTLSRRRVVLAQLAIGVVVAMIGAGPSLLYGTVGPWFAAACLATVWSFSSLSMIAMVLAVTAACPPWLRLSQAGIELAGSRTDPVFIAWPAVAPVRFRWHGPLTYLEVAPSDPAAVGWVDVVGGAQVGGDRGGSPSSLMWGS